MFDTAVFLGSAGLGKRMLEFQSKEAIFTQGQPANAVFYVQRGRAKLSVVSPAGKGAVLLLLGAGDFVGEESLGTIPGLRVTTATALTPCTLLRIERVAMQVAMREEQSLNDLMLAFLVARNVRLQEDQVDLLFNTSERRLARVLLLMAKTERPDLKATLIPPVTQETLADMVGTTRSRVSYFMNRFRKQGFIDYQARILVHPLLLNVVLVGQDLLLNEPIDMVPQTSAMISLARPVPGMGSVSVC